MPLSSGASLPAYEAKLTVAINVVADIVIARQHGRKLTLHTGCSSGESTLVATVISELARNVLLYAKGGEITVEKTRDAAQQIPLHGIRIACRDKGPGIADIPRVLQGGYSTSGGLGLGMSGVRKIVDEFDIETGVGKGTTVTVTKWLR
ncbi:MAG TPA: ATP-binding protein [Gammaproteobacteria bacterium]|nr:ATP-binding protein [Gammaproteobacteria bacterium]